MYVVDKVDRFDTFVTMGYSSNSGDIRGHSQLSTFTHSFKAFEREREEGHTKYKHVRRM